MAIVNRSYDSSEQKFLVAAHVSNTVTGISGIPLFRAAFPVQIIGITATATGLSGSPTSQLKIERFTVGTGLSVVALGGALTHHNFGTSGPQGFSLPAAGSSLLQLFTGDQITVTTGGSNAAAVGILIEFCFQALQDIKTFA